MISFLLILNTSKPPKRVYLEMSMMMGLQKSKSKNSKLCLDPNALLNTYEPVRFCHAYKNPSLLYYYRDDAEDTFANKKRHLGSWRRVQNLNNAWHTRHLHFKVGLKCKRGVQWKQKNTWVAWSAAVPWSVRIPPDSCKKIALFHKSLERSDAQKKPHR